MRSQCVVSVLSMPSQCVVSDYFAYPSGLAVLQAIERWSYASKQRLLLVIQLAMSIPGFSDLPLHDQIALIKCKYQLYQIAMIYDL